jgi:hypothetical protein
MVVEKANFWQKYFFFWQKYFFFSQKYSIFEKNLPKLKVKGGRKG